MNNIKNKSKAAIWNANNRERKKLLDKRAVIKKRFGLTLEEYEIIQNRLWREQEGKCAICGVTGSSYGKNYLEDKKTLHLDHCHKTGKIRGLLCVRCNKGIGYFEDNYEILYNASVYLKE